MVAAGPNNSPVIQKNPVAEIAGGKKVDSSCSLQLPASNTSSQHSSLNTSGEESINFNLNFHTITKLLRFQATDLW
jgi:hypothetical protein